MKKSSVSLLTAFSLLKKEAKGLRVGIGEKGEMRVVKTLQVQS